MLENENEKNIPEVEFTFREEEKSEEERKKEIDELIKKRNELLASMGVFVPSTNKAKINETSNDYPRHTR